MYVDAGVRVYGQEQVIPGDFSVGDYYVDQDTFEELRQYAVVEGDILVSCVGTFGKVAIVPAGIEPGIMNPRLIRLRCSARVVGEYLVDVLRSSVTFEQFDAFSRGGTMDVINVGTMNQIRVCLPPAEEQRTIHRYVTDAAARFEALSGEARRATNLLRERRTALICAAVTGQIDVRDPSARSAA